MKPYLWVSLITVLGLIFLLQGCSRREEPSSSERSTLVATSFPPPGSEVKDPHESALRGVDSIDNLLHWPSLAPGSTVESLREQLTPAELLEAFLWAVNSDDLEDPRLRTEISHALLANGDSTVRAIRNYLQGLDSPGIGGDLGEALEHTRLAVLDLLLSMDLPEVERLALELITDNPTPEATWRLALYLEGRNPGVYVAQIRNAAEKAMRNAASFDDIPGELFQIVGENGDYATMGLLADIPAYLDAYVSVALALLQDGSGLAQLEKDARLFGAGQYTMHGRLAIELLAQQANRFPGAAEVLLDLAEEQLIPSDLWPQVLAAVAGQSEISLLRPRSARIATHTIYQREGNLVIYRISRPPPNENPDPMGERTALLDQLRALAPERRISG